GWWGYGSRGCSTPGGHPGSGPSADGSGAGPRRNGRPTRRLPGSGRLRCARPAFSDRPVSYAEQTGRVLRVHGTERRRTRPAKIPTPDPRPAFRPAYPLVDLRVSSHLAVTVRRSI